MSDDQFYSPSHWRPVRQGELLFEFHRASDHSFWRCESRDRGAYGTEAQFLMNGDLIIGQLFRDVPNGDTVIPARQSATEWAQAERQAILDRR